jgi:hypothetical protein
MNYGHNNQSYFIADPNICPHCHVVNKPKRIWQEFTKDTDNILTFLSAWSCANEKCSKVFVCMHKDVSGSMSFKRFLNGLPKGPNWPIPIIELKNGNPKEPSKPEESRFIKTYLQSLVAENSGLDELAGMGYRKSIEYLVKDWAIQNNPSDKETIENCWLGQVIKDYYNWRFKRNS